MCYTIFKVGFGGSTMDRSESIIKEVIGTMFPLLNEAQRRLLAGSLAKGYGYGGEKIVREHSNLSAPTMSKAAREVKNKTYGHVEAGRSRKIGGGRKSLLRGQNGLLDFIDSILQQNTYGNPMSVVSYTSLSMRDIAKAVFDEKGIKISQNIVSNALEELGYSKQKNQKMEQLGEQHPDRDAQFKHINKTGIQYIANGQPFISVDCKKKENIGNFKNTGKEYRHIQDARRVLDHDFPIAELGKVAPYGIYSINDNTGFINLGTSHDTAEFAVQSVRSWWYSIGKHTFPDATKLYISADGGGSNGSRNRLWKWELAKMAQETGLEIEVSHFPPGTSKWNKVEHRLFCYISKNWEGKPLLDIVTVVKLITSTTTQNGLKVACTVDNNIYETGLKVDDKDLDKIDIEFLGPNKGWNYIIRGLKN